MVGKKLGHYEILEPLGAGGMGEVYRALDTKLDRDVAIKVLPEALSDDPDRLARLEREAKVLASLNHPNIAVIHGLDEDEGAIFLVLELVKGESMEQLLAKGRLPIEEALDLCMQIALALEAAHNEGIVHRDLKPANVLITPDGRAKVLCTGILALGLALLAACARQDVPVKATDADTFHEELLFVQSGELPILLVAPHGAGPDQGIPGVPERTGASFLLRESSLRAGKWGGFQTRRDGGSDRLIVQVSEALERDLGRRPYAVIARFGRAYADVNRPPEDAFEDPSAEPYYRAYHEAIERLVGEIQERWGRGILLDIHGGASPGEIQLGTRDGRTVANLFEAHREPAWWGPNSIYGKLRANGYNVLPAPGEPEYMPGGYTPDTHGTLAGGLDAVQVEIFGPNGGKGVDELSEDLAAALVTFHDAFLPIEQRR